MLHELLLRLSYANPVIAVGNINLYPEKFALDLKYPEKFALVRTPYLGVSILISDIFEILS